MPAHDRPKRQSVKATTKAERAEIDAARKAGKNAEADTAQNELEKIWKDVFPTLNDYKPPYDVILKCRETIATQILNLKNGEKHIRV